MMMRKKEPETPADEMAAAVIVQYDKLCAELDAKRAELAAEERAFMEANIKPVKPVASTVDRREKKRAWMNGLAPSAVAPLSGPERYWELQTIDRPAIDEAIEESRNEQRRAQIKTLAGTFARHEEHLRPILARERWHIEQMQQLNQQRTEICRKTFQQCYGLVQSVFYVPWAGFELCGRARDTSGEASEFLDALDKAGIRAAKEQP
jgi:hypothetical protein